MSSEGEVVAAALRAYRMDIETIRALADPALASADRGEGMDGDAFMRELIEHARDNQGG